MNRPHVYAAILRPGVWLNGIGVITSVVQHPGGVEVVNETGESHYFEADHDVYDILPDWPNAFMARVDSGVNDVGHTFAKRVVKRTPRGNYRDVESGETYHAGRSIFHEFTELVLVPRHRLEELHNTSANDHRWKAVVDRMCEEAFYAR